jgi:cholesterol transport system auxiliary component
MKKSIRIAILLLTVLACIMPGGCAVNGAEPLTLYDLGLLRPSQGNTVAPAPPPISVAEVSAPAWLDSPMMFFRLAYANDQQPRPYGTSRWSMPPAQLFVQRLKSRISEAGGVVLSASDGATNMPVLRIAADDFTQVFTSPGQGIAQISVRASMLNGRTLIAQKTFTKQMPAPTADASGGARALADASDAVIVDMMNWLAGLPLKKY